MGAARISQDWKWTLYVSGMYPISWECIPSKNKTSYQVAKLSHLSERLPRKSYQIDAEPISFAKIETARLRQDPNGISVLKCNV